MHLSDADLALVELGRGLRAAGYHFITPTPATHARVNARPGNQRARTLRDVFGWSRPFDAAVLPNALWALLERSGRLERHGGLFRSAVRFSSLGEDLFAHSAFPTRAADAVFFGPDTYRFARMLQALPGRFERAVDIGAGTGAGGLSLRDRCDELVLTDVNPAALRLAGVNAALNGARVELFESNLLASVPGDFDLIVSNPPYLVDDGQRAYRHGGVRGIELSVRLAEEALGRLRPGGHLALYTATPIVEGRDLLTEALTPCLRNFDGTFRWTELDPDVFGEELDRPAYFDVERLAVVSIVATFRSPREETRGPVRQPQRTSPRTGSMEQGAATPRTR